MANSMTEKSTAAHRQRLLALELGKRKGMVAVRTLKTLSPELGEAYSGKTRKTVTRDLNMLHKSGLITHHREIVHGHKELLKAFLPGRRAESKRQ